MSTDPGAAAAAFGRLVAVMDRLRSPGGCPWDAEQTHTSLVPYALEEVHELAEAVDAGDRAGLREELGDVLLQVVFHARVAQDDPADPFDVAEVADRLVAKLVRRHPHVFGDGADEGLAPGDVHRRWDDAKRAEKPARASALDGVPASLGALARTQKVAGKAVRAGLLALPAADEVGPRVDAVPAPAPSAPAVDETGPAPADADDVDAAVAAVTGSERSAPAAAAPDAPAADQRSTGAPAADERAHGRHADAPGSDDARPDDRAADDRAPADRAADDRAPADRAADDRAPADRAADDRAPDDRAPADRAPDERDSAFGARLLALVLQAEREGVDAEGALRRAAAAWEVGLRAAESAGTADAPTPWA